ncbi:MAG TPA: hypothetical protein PKW15_00660 [Alphaproteobacteria bacterium]|nr:hypothetical protein [Rhodospirillaceae bacterium]HRJ11734.1 hypothetical protein [Alphaproteobacteria bacterium]
MNSPAAQTKRAFIFGTMYIDAPYKAELVQMWIELHQKLNPEYDLLIIDSHSERMWLDLIPAIKNIPIHEIKEGDPLPPLQRGVNWIDFPEGAGHQNFNGVDGWGRAFSRGVAFAIQHDYEYVVNLECDLLFRNPVTPILDQMDTHHLHVLSTNIKYNKFFPLDWMENTIMFMRTSYLREKDFIRRYDWNGNWTRDNPLYVPEHRCKAILEPEVFYKPWQGVRGDGGIDLITQLSDVEEMDYIMHVQHAPNYPQPLELYYHFMRKYMGQDWIPPHRRSQNV